jgi:hypothetical protein
VPRVVVLILHPDARSDAGPLERWVADARAGVAEGHVAGFAEAGADHVRMVTGPPDDTSFGARLRGLVADVQPAGLVVLGAGSVPLAGRAARRALVAAAASREPGVLTNNRYSADVVAVSCADVLRDLPDLPADNALPRWLDEVAGYPVRELRGWRLGVDVDGPLDLVLLGGAGRNVRPPPAVDLSRVRRALAGVASVAADRRAELVVAGRTSTATLRWLETRAAARVRALVEERGLRAASPSAYGDEALAGRPRRIRAPRSILGMLLDRDGPGSLGRALAELGDGALVDSRVLLAHRLGTDEAAWPVAEERFASDLLLHERIGDPWLAELTRSAAEAPLPVVLGGHTLVGPGLRLALRRLAAR